MKSSLANPRPRPRIRILQDYAVGSCIDLYRTALKHVLVLDGTNYIKLLTIRWISRWRVFSITSS